LSIRYSNYRLFRRAIPAGVGPANAHAGWYGDCGSSASAPAMAAMFAMLNNERLAKGRPALGFLNPMLFKAAAEHRGGAAFADVSAGDNKWPVQCFLNQSAGFVSQKGWDPVTGLGNPNFRELLKFLEHMDGVRDARKQKQAQEGEPDR